MKNALILHGMGGDSQSDWFPWLKGELERQGYKVWVPDLPGADQPSIERYNKFIFDNWQFDQDSLIVGHSAGSTAILGLLQNFPEGIVIAKAILVAGFSKELGAGWESLKGLFEKPFDFEKIKKHCRQFVFIHSDDDPYVALEMGELMENQINGQLVVLKSQKHFSVEAGGEQYKQFPELLKYI